MLTEEKIAAIKKQLRNGEPEGELRNELIKQGYSKEELEKFFVPHKYDMRTWYLVFAIIFLLIGLYELIIRKSLLFLLFSAGMFCVYYWETQRKSKEKLRD